MPKRMTVFRRGMLSRQNAWEDVAEKLLKVARIDINPQQPSATSQGPDTAKPALGGLRWYLNWWSRGDLNPRLSAMPRCLQGRGWHKAVITQTLILHAFRCYVLINFGAGPNDVQEWYFADRYLLQQITWVRLFF